MKFSGFQLKIIALVLMFGEHFGRYLGELLPNRFPLYLEYAGRIVAPIFFYLAVESYFKTSNRRRYITRLYAWALIMQIGNFINSQIVQTAYQPELFFQLDRIYFYPLRLA